MDIISGQGINNEKEIGVEDIVTLWKTNAAMQEIKKEPAEDTVDFISVANRLVKQRGAPFLYQMLYCHNLSLIQQYRGYNNLILELFVATAAGLLMGLAIFNIDEVYLGMLPKPYTILSTSPLVWAVVQIPLLVGIAVALAGSPAGVNVFGNELHIYWRKAAAGHNTLAYYLGKSLSSVYRIVIASMHFSALFYCLGHPVLPYWVEFIVVALTFFGVYSLAGFVSMVVKRDSATLLAVVIALFSAVFCGYGLTIKAAKNMRLYFIWCLQFNMWGAQARCNKS